MIVRLGIPASFRRFSAVATEIGKPILVSANALRRDGRFHYPATDLFAGADVALDSAGFVAMMDPKTGKPREDGGYRWSAREYVALAGAHPRTWWASMDYCCEPQIAGSREGVALRQKFTIYMLLRLRLLAAEAGVKPPMPVLQGWTPDDYERCAEMMGNLPTLVGVGSVCRRSIGGAHGLAAVLTRLDRVLPRHVKLHLFGVKGTAIGVFAGHPRILSMDSQAWDRAARWEASKGRFSCDVAHREKHLRKWAHDQRDQLGLFSQA